MDGRECLKADVFALMTRAQFAPQRETLAEIGDRKAKLIYKVEPEYTADARDMREHAVEDFPLLLVLVEALRDVIAQIAAALRNADRQHRLDQMLLGLLLQAIPFIIWTPLLLLGTWTAGSFLDFMWMFGMLLIAASALRFTRFLLEKIGNRFRRLPERIVQRSVEFRSMIDADGFRRTGRSRFHLRSCSRPALRT